MIKLEMSAREAALLVTALENYMETLLGDYMVSSETCLDGNDMEVLSDISSQVHKALVAKGLR